MLQTLRNRSLRAARRPVESDLDRFEFRLSLEEIIADLDFGVGPMVEIAELVPEGRPQVGRVA